jgi:hypothetical protein
MKRNVSSVLVLLFFSRFALAQVKPRARDLGIPFEGTPVHLTPSLMSEAWWSGIPLLSQGNNTCPEGESYVQRKEKI